MAAKPWLRALQVLAGLQILGALTGFVFADLDRSSAFGHLALPPRFFILPLIAFGCAGVALLVWGRDDARAVSLGTAFLLLASPFSSRWLLALIEVAPRPLALPVVILRSLHVDSFFPLFFWRFTREFPQTHTPRLLRRVVAAAIWISALAGAFLFLKELWRLVRRLQVAAAGLALAQVAPEKPSYEHYSILAVLSAGALFVLLWRARKATGAERRRVRLFVGALTAGVVPYFLLLPLGFLVQELRPLLERPFPLVAGCFLLFVSTPFTTAYAVLVHHVLNVKLLARRAIQYALARGVGGWMYS